jgi:hypothetical protein
MILYCYGIIKLKGGEDIEETRDNLDKRSYNGCDHCFCFCIYSFQ